MKKIVLFTITLLLGTSFQAIGKKTETLWRKLLHENANCVTWVSVTVKLEISAGGRSLPPQEQKLEALGTIIAEDGLTVLSLNKVDPTANILSRLRSPGASVTVNYTEVMLLMQDGTEVPAKILLKDVDLDLAYVLPIKERKDEYNEITFSKVPSQATQRTDPLILDEVVSIGKLRQTLYRQSTLRRGCINAVIQKPRKYFVIENTTPGTPVFDQRGKWLGVVVYKMVGGRPSEIVTLPASDVLEIAQQVRTRTE
ncbi:MAG: hypothetical protein P8P49_07740 [Opitutales bacterium]|nr:hypothetical protein [Opitutales bacterium]MDG1325643.1 hypothetical protein [Opitutales bacterium]